MLPDTSSAQATSSSLGQTALDADIERALLSPRERLKNFMGENGLRQADVASEIGCTQAHVSMLLNKKCDVSLNTARALERLTRGLIRATDWATSP